MAAYAARELATRLTDLGYVLVPRADGNGFEIGGVDQEVMDAFSSRRAQITPEVARMAEEYRQRYGREPSQRTLWAMAQEATLETRKAKSRGRSDRSGQPARTAGDELDEWEARTTEREVGTLSGVHEAVAAVCSARGPGRSGRAGRQLAGRALSGWRWPRPSATRRRLPGRRCCGSCTGPCRPWRPGWTRRPWPRSWRTRRWPLLRSWRWARRRTWWTCPRWACGPVTAGPSSPPPGPSGTPRRRSWTWRSTCWPRRAVRSPQLVTPHAADVAAGGRGPRTRTRPRWRPGSSRRGPPCPCWWPRPGRARPTSWPRSRGPGRPCTGGRVVGVTLSTNAARVMATEGLAEAYNVAQSLGRREDGSPRAASCELGPRDVVVIDEASQVSTADLAAPGGPRAAAGARLVLVGDTAQLGAVEAGGMMRLIARRPGPLGAGRGAPVRRGMGGAGLAPAPPGSAGRAAGLRRSRPCPWRPPGRGRAGRGGPVPGGLPAGPGLAPAGRHERGGGPAGRHGPGRAGRASARCPARPEVTLADGNGAARGDLVRARENTRAVDAAGRRLDQPGHAPPGGRDAGGRGPGGDHAAPARGRGLVAGLPRPAGLPPALGRAGLCGQRLRGPGPHGGHRACPAWTPRSPASRCMWP